jgi:hypothetical protein
MAAGSALLQGVSWEELIAAELFSVQQILLAHFGILAQSRLPAGSDFLFGFTFDDLLAKLVCSCQFIEKIIEKLRLIWRCFVKIDDPIQVHHF